MSLLLATIRTRTESRGPLVRILCAHCARVYVASYYPNEVKKRRYCSACNPTTFRSRGC